MPSARLSHQRAYGHLIYGISLLCAAVLLVSIQTVRGAKQRSERPPGYRVVPVAELLALARVPTPAEQPSGYSAPQQHPPRSQPGKLSDGDFVFATGSCKDRMALAKSTRAWRRGIRAFVLTDQNETQALLRLNTEGMAHNESYAFFPDDGDAALGFARHGTKDGDTRAAVAPFAAHRHFGDTYKFLLYGDDDTLFYMDAVRRMLSAFDPDLPLVISDNLWYMGQHPNPHAPRCLPCHLANESLPSLEAIMRTPHMQEALRKHLAKARPEAEVTEAELEAEARDATEVPGRRFVPRPACPYCTPRDACPLVEDPKKPCKPSGAHGGAGMIFSVGLMRLISLEAALECFQGFEDAPGGDYMVSSCLWKHNIAFTDPGPLVRHLYDPHYHVFGGGKGLGFLMDPIGMLTRGRCDAKCRWMLRNTLSLHVQGRHYRSWRVSSMYMWGVAHASEAARSFLDLMYPSLSSLPYGADAETAPPVAAPEVVP